MRIVINNNLTDNFSIRGFEPSFENDIISFTSGTLDIVVNDVIESRFYDGFEFTVERDEDFEVMYFIYLLEKNDNEDDSDDIEIVKITVGLNQTNPSKDRKPIYLLGNTINCVLGETEKECVLNCERASIKESVLEGLRNESKEY